MIEMRQARYFVAVAEELHFGRAAERLHMTQPPLSQAIRQLERDLGVSLFERTSRSVVLTEAGTVLLSHCYRMIAAGEYAVTAVMSAQAGQLGTLQIGAVASAFSGPLRRILDQFRVLHPRVELKVEEVDTNDALQSLIDFKLGVAIVRYAGSDPRLRADPVRGDRFVAALPQNHLLVEQRRSVPTTLPLTDLAELPWVWIPRDISPNYHDTLIMACQQAGFSPDVQHKARSIQTQLHMVSCGIGVALVPQTAAVPIDGVVYMPLDFPLSLVELALVRRAGESQPLVERFAACALGDGGGLVD